MKKKDLSAKKNQIEYRIISMCNECDNSKIVFHHRYIEVFVYYKQMCLTTAAMAM